MFHSGGGGFVGPVEEETGRIPVLGGEVWYRRSDRGGAGLPLLVVHGGPGACHDYLEPLVALAAERPVIFWDQLGGGASDRPADRSLWTLERFVGEVAAVRAALGLDRVHLLGQSFGALLAVAYLLDRGDEGVASLALSGPLLSAPRWAEDQRAWLARMEEPHRRAVEEAERTGAFHGAAYRAAMQAYSRRHLCRLDPWPDCLTRTFAKLDAAVRETMWGPSAFTVSGTLKTTDLTGALDAIGVPALITCGRFDEAPPATCAWFARRLPRGRLAVFEDASHAHHLERPEAYLQTLRGFLAERDRSAPWSSPA